MAYVASIHHASSVRHAIASYFKSPEEKSLILAKANRVEIYQFTGDSLVLEKHFTVYGHVTVLLTHRPDNSTTDHLFIATDRYDYFTLSWDPQRQTIVNQRAARDMSDNFLRNAKYGPFYVSDPKGRFLGLHIYQGVFTLIPIIQAQKGKRKKTVSGGSVGGSDTVGDIDEPYPIRLLELKAKSMAFLDTSPDAILAMLYEDGQDDVHLKCYKVKITGKDKDLEELELKGKLVLDPGAKIVIPVLGELGGMIILGEQKVQYVDISGREYATKSYILREPTDFATWAKKSETEYLLGDEYGKLYALNLVIGGRGTMDELKVREIGQISTPTRLVYLGNDYAFVGSHSGDSQLVKIYPEETKQENKLEVVQKYDNLAPVLDFRVLDMGYSGSDDQQHLYSSGQTRIITGSGALRDGSLRSLRSGVGLEDLAILGDMAGIRGLWGLKSNPGSKYDDTLLVSFINETRVFRFNSEGEIEEEPENFNGFSLDEGTLTSGNVCSGRILQVTSSFAKVADADSGTVVGEWRPPSGATITMAAHNDESLIVACGGGIIVYLDLREHMRCISSRTFPQEVASVAIPTTPANLCIMGSWTTSIVSVLHLPSLETVLEQDCGSGDGGAIPRSLLLANILENQPPTLLVAMGDGKLHTFSFDEKKMELSQRKIIILGTQAVYLKAIPRDNGNFNVFATCDHPSLLYGSEGRMVYSAVRAENATFVAPFNSEAFPHSVVVATEEDLKITVVDQVRKIDVQTLPVGDMVRRVCHSKERRVFGLVTIKQELEVETGLERFRCFVRVVDDVDLKELDSYELDNLELVESIMCAPLDDGEEGSSTSDKFVVGTGYEDEDKDIATKGRILVFELSEDRKLKLAYALDIIGGCKGLDIVEGKIVAALQRTVVMFNYHYPHSQTKPVLSKMTSYRAQSDPMDLSVCGRTIAVADMMKGATLLNYKPEEATETQGSFFEIARNYSTQWSTAICLLDEETVVSGDSEGNLLIQKIDKNGVTAEDKRRLRLVGDMRLGEMINRIRRVDENLLQDTAVVPRAYFGTTEGSVYLLGLISPDKQDLLMQLQANLSQEVKGFGDLDFNRFRGFSSTEKTSEEPFRFVDGDFIEKFLELPEEIMEKVAKGRKKNQKLSMGVEELKTLVENLKRLH